MLVNYTNFPGLGEKVDVVGLDRVVDEPKPEALAATLKGTQDDAIGSDPPQVGSLLPDAHGDEHGKP